MDEKKIWDALMEQIGNPFGVAGAMGNIYAESGLKADNLENQYEKKLGMTDAEYVKAVDSGKHDFIKDKAGFGLCQWTYYTRKRGLLELAQSKKKSIADVDVQIEYLFKELGKGYKHCLNVLKKAQSIQEASDVFMIEFEKPADQSQTAKNTRASFGQRFYDKYASNKAENKPNEASIKTDRPNYRVATPKGLNVRQKPTTASPIVTQMRHEVTVYVAKVENGWGYIPSHKGWSMMAYMERI